MKMPKGTTFPVLSFYDDDGSEEHFCGECDAAGHTATLVCDVFEIFTCVLCGNTYTKNNEGWMKYLRREDVHYYER